MNKYTTIFILTIITGTLLASGAQFITQSSPSGPSRNQVKEQFGARLHDVLRVSADLEHAVGLFMMRVGALKRSLATQASALLDDTPPFNTASTRRLQKAAEQTDGYTKELEKLLAQVGQLNDKVAAAVRVEDGK